MNRSNPRIDSRPRETNVTTRVPAGIDRFANPPRRGAGVIELGLDPVEMNLDLGVKAPRERLLLPVGRRVAGIAIDQGRQGRRVDAPRKERGGLGRRQVDPIRDVAMAVGEVIFAIDDDRAVDDLAQQQGRSASAAVSDDQVGAQARPGIAPRRGRSGIARGNVRRSGARECRRSSDARPPGASGAARASRASRARGSDSSKGSAPGSCTASRGAGSARGRAGRTGRGRRRG